MPILKISRADRRRISAFFTCLLLAALAWIFVMLSKNYTFPAKVVLKFKNHPGQKAFHALQADTVVATVSGTGWQKLLANIHLTKNNSFNVDLKKLETQNLIVLSSQLNASNNKLAKEQQLIAFNPDTIYFDFTARKEKRVPIRLRTNLSFQRQYARSGEVLLNPAFVTISGPAAYVDAISSWPTDYLVGKKVSNPIKATLKLPPPPENNIEIYPKTVSVAIPVEEYTEKTLEVPVKLLNNKTYSQVGLFPAKVKITFLVSLNQFAAINTDFFEIVADLNAWQLRGKQTLPVQLKQQPDYCKIVSVQPANINFIVRR